MTRTSKQRAMRRPLQIGAAVAIAAMLAGCSGGDSESTAAETTTTVTSAPTTAASALTSTTVDLPDAADLLDQALQRYAGGYEFSATVTVNDQVSTVQTGRWLDGASQLVIESGDGVVEYITTADGQWSRLPAGEWEQVATTGTTESPLAALASPGNPTLIDYSGDTATLSADYPADALGVSGDPVTATLLIAGGNLAEISYATTVDGAAVSSTTTFSALTDETPIVAPATP